MSDATKLDTGFAGSAVSQAEHDEVLRELVHMRGQRDAAQSALVEARAILSKAVGENDEPHETLADCARLLVLDCDAEHERAVAAEAERDAATAEVERLRAELTEQTTLAHTMEAELRTERLLRINDANRHREEVARIRAEAASQRVDLARCEGCPWETRP